MSLFQGVDLTCIRGERHVFTGLGFAVHAGGALVLVGPNGSGKSSLLRLMAGLNRPASGGLSWAGVPIAGDPEAHRARVRYVGHLDCVKAVLSVRENLSFWAARSGAPLDPPLHALRLLIRGTAPPQGYYSLPFDQDELLSLRDQRWRKRWMPTAR